MMGRRAVSNLDKLGRSVIVSDIVVSHVLTVCEAENNATLRNIIAALKRPAETEVMVYPFCLVCGCTYKLSDFNLGSLPRYSLVVDEDVNFRNQTNKPH